MASNVNGPAIAAIDTARSEVVTLLAKLAVKDIEIERLKRAPDETHRLLRALLLSGSEVALSLRPFQPYGGSTPLYEYPSNRFYNSDYDLRIYARERDGSKYAVDHVVNIEGEKFIRNDGFALALDRTLAQLWDGKWR